MFSFTCLLSKFSTILRTRRDAPHLPFISFSSNLPRKHDFSNTFCFGFLLIKQLDVISVLHIPNRTSIERVLNVDAHWVFHISNLTSIERVLNMDAHWVRYSVSQCIQLF
jgi:hypothetical protein